MSVSVFVHELLFLWLVFLHLTVFFTAFVIVCLMSSHSSSMSTSGWCGFASMICSTSFWKFSHSSLDVFFVSMMSWILGLFPLPLLQCEWLLIVRSVAISTWYALWSVAMFGAVFVVLLVFWVASSGVMKM